MPDSISPEAYARKLEANRRWKLKTGYRPDRAKALAAVMKWQAANPEKVKQARRKRHYLKRYSLTVDELEEMIDAQRGKCAACGDEFGSRKYVDHCHTTGKVRGVLCNGCNLALGHTKDDTERLGALIRYLDRSRSIA